jgi:hypothetical protein
MIGKSDVDQSYVIDTKSVQRGKGMKELSKRYNNCIFLSRLIIYNEGACPFCFTDMELKKLKRLLVETSA